VRKSWLIGGPWLSPDRPTERSLFPEGAGGPA
jgi:hypothetical protein